ncbi:MAG: DUF1799 domain-containing protein [Dinoroseobacter sp.]|nr:DUF1799 domain-containing protein [Dinoroseobacter sp.]
MALGGMSETDALAMASDELPDVVRLPAYLEPLVSLVDGVHNQWRVMTGLGGGGPMGFDLNAVAHVAGWLKIDITPKLFGDLRLIEAEALQLMRRAKT